MLTLELILHWLKTDFKIFPAKEISLLFLNVNVAYKFLGQVKKAGVSAKIKKRMISITVTKAVLLWKLSTLASAVLDAPPPTILQLPTKMNQ